MRARTLDGRLLPRGADLVERRLGLGFRRRVLRPAERLQVAVEAERLLVRLLHRRVEGDPQRRRGPAFGRDLGQHVGAAETSGEEAIEEGVALRFVEPFRFFEIHAPSMARSRRRFSARGYFPPNEKSARASPFASSVTCAVFVP